MHTIWGQSPQPRETENTSERKLRHCVYSSAFMAEIGLLFWLGIMLGRVNRCELSIDKKLWFTLEAVGNIVLYVIGIWLVSTIPRSIKRGYPLALAALCLAHIAKLMIATFAILELADGGSSVEVVVAIILEFFCLTFALIPVVWYGVRACTVHRVYPTMMHEKPICESKPNEPEAPVYPAGGQSESEPEASAGAPTVYRESKLEPATGTSPVYPVVVPTKPEPESLVAVAPCMALQESKATAADDDDAPGTLAPRYLDITGISCSGLMKGADKSGLSDPYIIFSVGGKYGGKTATVSNTGDPAWASRGSPTLDFGKGHSVRMPITVKIRIKDDDHKSPDDPMGDATFTVAGAGDGRVDAVALSTQGTMKVTWEATNIQPQEGVACDSEEAVEITRELG